MAERCIRCRKEATVNFQKLWVKWEYNFREDKYSPESVVLDIEPLEGENLHFCSDCAELWEQGEI